MAETTETAPVAPSDPLESPEQVLAKLEATNGSFSARGLRVWVTAIAIVVFYLFAGHLAQVDLAKLAAGLPKLWHWISQAWPPTIDEVPFFLLRTAET
ncbi:MAG: hypothetical protein WA707_09795, partial [Pseudolabrys sp.]